VLYLKEVLVDGRRIKDHCFPVGLLDVVQLKPSKQNYRVVLDKKGKLDTIEIDEKDAKQKICQIMKKTVLKGGKIQLNLSDSRNIIATKDEYKTGDSLLIELPSQKIAGHFKLEKGAFVMLTAGKHIAETGIVEKAGSYVVIYKDEKGNMKTTSRKYAFVLGKEKPSIKIK
jgi:small subunit ribosomal protein S4e